MAQPCADCVRYGQVIGWLLMAVTSMLGLFVWAWYESWRRKQKRRQEGRVAALSPQSYQPPQIPPRNSSMDPIAARLEALEERLTRLERRGTPVAGSDRWFTFWFVIGMLGCLGLGIFIGYYTG